MKKEINLLKIYGFVLFCGVGTFFPYIYLYMERLGFSNAQIGVLAALGPLIMMFVQPFWGWVSDWTGEPQRVSFWLALGVASSVLLLISGKVFWIVLLLMGIFNIFYSSLIPTFDCIVIGTLANRETQRKVNYGKIRWLGSLGFALAAFIVGRIIEVTDVSICLWLYAFEVLVLAFLASRLPRVSVIKSKREKVQIWPLLKNRDFLLFLTAASLVIGSNAINYTFFPFLIKDLGGGEGLIGLTMLVSAFAEIPFFFYSSRIHERFNLSYLLLFAFGVTGLRWFLYSIASSPYQLLFGQLLHGITYGLLYSTSVIYVSRLTPAKLIASGQNLFWAATFGFGNVIGNVFGGWIYEYYPVQILFALASIAAVSGTLIFITGTFVSKENLVRK